MLSALGHPVNPGGGVHVPQGYGQVLHVQVVRQSPGQVPELPEAEAVQVQVRGSLRPGSLRRNGMTATICTQTQLPIL